MISKSVHFLSARNGRTALLREKSLLSLLKEPLKFKTTVKCIISCTLLLPHLRLYLQRKYSHAKCRLFLKMDNVLFDRVSI